MALETMYLYGPDDVLGFGVSIGDEAFRYMESSLLPQNVRRHAGDHGLLNEGRGTVRENIGRNVGGLVATGITVQWVRIGRGGLVGQSTQGRRT